MIQNLDERFDEKIKELNESLPKLKVNANCAELTLTSVLDILGIDNHFFHNAAIPLAGGFGGYKSKSGWQGACGAVCGGCSAVGVILGGGERMDNETMLKAYLKAAKFASVFEKEYGSVVCSELCGYDFSQSEEMTEYQRSGTWAKKCYKYVVWAVDKVRNLTRKELKNKWE
ncbi:MAG: C_GCAxxG_C_C family protein [Candidatus Lokiarchaeota archaeon]|nr:C_GCAxxG_C_C family protein [Candidatus Lokiarchaeota archaeon]